MEAEVNPSLILSIPAEYKWVSNEVLTVFSIYHIQEDVAKVTPLVEEGS